MSQNIATITERGKFELDEAREQILAI